MGADRAAHLRLALALEQLQPQSSGALSALLSTAVLRLVRQIAGEVEVDVALLEKRSLGVAACVEDEVAEPALHLSPHDIPLLANNNLPLPLLSDDEQYGGWVWFGSVVGWVREGN